MSTLEVNHFLKRVIFNKSCSPDWVKTNRDHMSLNPKNYSPVGIKKKCNRPDFEFLDNKTCGWDEKKEFGPIGEIPCFCPSLHFAGGPGTTFAGVRGLTQMRPDSGRLDFLFRNFLILHWAACNGAALLGGPAERYVPMQGQELLPCDAEGVVSFKFCDRWMMGVIFF